MMDETAKEKQSDDLIDLDDPRLKESQNYDPEADYSAFIPPPEIDSEGNAIEYFFKLGIGEKKIEGKDPIKGMYFKSTEKSGTYGVFPLTLELVQPGGDFDRFKLGMEYPHTIIDKRKGTSQIVDLMRLLGEPMPKGLDLAQIKQYVEGVIAANPILPGRIVWGAPYCTNCQKEYDSLAGERKWPEKKDEQGKVVGHVAKVECPECNTDLTPKVKVKRYFPKVG